MGSGQLQTHSSETKVRLTCQSVKFLLRILHHHRYNQDHNQYHQFQYHHQIQKSIFLSIKLPFRDTYSPIAQSSKFIKKMSQIGP